MTRITADERAALSRAFDANASSDPRNEREASNVIPFGTLGAQYIQRQRPGLPPIQHYRRPNRFAAVLGWLGGALLASCIGAVLAAVLFIGWSQ